MRTTKSTFEHKSFAGKIETVFIRFRYHVSNKICRNYPGFVLFYAYM